MVGDVGRMKDEGGVKSEELSEVQDQERREQTKTEQRYSSSSS